METKQISLKDVYGKLLKLEMSLSKVDQYIEDLEFARRTNEAWERYEDGEFKSLSEEEFLEELDKL